MLFASSCKVLYPGMMFQQKDYQVFELKDKLVDEYIIKPGDELSLDFFTRDGQSLIEKNISYIEGINSVNTSTVQYSYIVKPNGYVSLPIIGDYFVQGYTSNSLKKMLESELSRLYIDPYVNISVNNRRVFLFKGYTGSVVKLNQTPTHLVEVLALSGGLDRDLKAYKIRVIRGDYKNPTIYNVDLSTLHGLATSDIILQSNDIVYVEPRKKIIGDSFKEVSVVVSFITSVVSTIVLITRIK